MKKGFISVISGLAGAVVGAGVVGKIEGKVCDKAQKMSGKHFSLFLMMNQWVKVKQEGKNLATYFANNGYKKIAVYGMSYAGETLIEELQGSGIEIAYGIDREAAYIYSDIEIVSADGVLEEVDAVIVTAITFFDEIEKNLSHKLDCPIISLEDILYEV